MTEPRRTDFRPRWARRPKEEYAALADTPNTGTEPEGKPKLPTRVILPEGRTRITAGTLSDILATTQRIVSFAGCELLYDSNPDFADLRSADSRILQLSRLSVEPFDEGSFVVPAELAEEDVEIEVRGRTRTLSAAEVLTRFVRLMKALGGSEEAPPTNHSIGAIQAVEELGKILKREATAVEYSPSWAAAPTPPPIVVNEAYVERVAAVREARERPGERSELIEGMLVALDLARGTFKLRMGPHDKTYVPGTFVPLMQDRLIRMLGRRVRLSGLVETRRGRITHVRAASVEPPVEP